MLDHAISFACSYLELDVNLTIQFERLEKGKCGYCDYDEDEVIITIAKRLSLKEILRTLFHEMVHVKQHVEGRLEYGYKWMGIVYEDNYHNLPWEIEAYELEERMMKIFYG